MPSLDSSTATRWRSRAGPAPATLRSEPTRSGADTGAERVVDPRIDRPLPASRQLDELAELLVERHPRKQGLDAS